jgi:hypothetical protein
MNLRSKNAMLMPPQVARKRFVDDIAVEAVETIIIARLGDILSPIKIIHLDADTVKSVAGESEESRAKRKQLTSHLEVLARGLETCKRFMVGKLQGMWAVVPQYIVFG